MRNLKIVYDQRIIDCDDFKREVINELVIHKINITRATFLEAQQFRDLVIQDILSNNLKIIVDLSECDYIDSTFLGALVIILKKTTEFKKEVRYVNPKPNALALIKLTGLLRVFNLYNSLQDAIDSFEYPLIENI